MTADANTADDVLQETNLVLLRKESDFQPGTDFVAWASQVAAFQVKNDRAKRGRDRLTFDDALLGQLASEGFVEAVPVDYNNGLFGMGILDVPVGR